MEYDPNLNLFCMNTDSYFVETKRGHNKIIKENSNEWDASDYHKNHECYDVKNKVIDLKINWMEFL